MRRQTMFDLAVLAALPAAVLVGLATGETFVMTVAARAAILAIAGMGLNLALGFGGMVSFGHAAFFGIGGYAAGILASHARNGVPLIDGPLAVAGTTSMPAIWIVAASFAALAAVPIGMLSLRTGGVYFIMITLAFAQMLYYFAISWPSYGGEDGLSFYVRNEMPGMNTMDPMVFFAIAFAVLLVVFAVSRVIVRSNFGLVLDVARQNAQRLSAVGIGPFRVRLTAFVISAAVTGLAGALYADLNRFVSPTMLSWHTSGEIMVLVILGGVGRLAGPVAGACVFVLLEQVLGSFTEYWQIFLGIGLLAVVLFARGGVAGLVAGRRAGDA